MGDGATIFWETGHVDHPLAVLSPIIIPTSRAQYQVIALEIFYIELSYIGSLRSSRNFT